MYIEPTIKNIFSQSWEIFQTNFKSILIITLLIYIPINIVLELLPVGDDVQGFMTYLRAIQLLELVFGLLAIIAIAFLTKAALEHSPITWQESLKKAFNKWLKVLGTNLLAGILLVGLFFLLIVPGIIYSIFWYFVVYVVIFSDKMGLQAMSYSKEIVKNRWWKTFGFILLFGIIAIFISLIAGIPLIFMPENFVLYVVGDLLIDMVGSFFSVLGTIFFLAWDSTKIENPEIKKVQSA